MGPWWNEPRDREEDKGSDGESFADSEGGPDGLRRLPVCPTECSSRLCQNPCPRTRYEIIIRFQNTIQYMLGCLRYLSTGANASWRYDVVNNLVLMTKSIVGHKVIDI